MNYDPKDRMTPAEASKYLGLSETTLAIWRSTGRVKLKYYKAGGRVYYLRPHLDEYVQSQIRGGEGE